MLEFETEEQSLQLVASSETHEDAIEYSNDQEI
jgi:hypothetical protein